MNEIKILTIDDINQLKGLEREEALRTWQKHSKESWERTKKEMQTNNLRIANFKAKKKEVETK